MTLLKIFPFLCAIALGVFVSCSSKKKENDFGIGKNRPNSLIRNHLLFSTMDQSYSFPIWFDDSLITVNKIESITRNIFPESADLKRLDSGRVVPAETFRYFFRQNGEIEKIVHLAYFDHKLIGKSIYKYGPTNPENGYAKANRQTEFTFETVPTSSDKTDNTYLYRKVSVPVEKNDNYLKFKGITQDEFLFIVPNKKKWGPFRIHQKLKPGPKDQIILGSAYFPLKKYSVSNTIRETNVQKFEYEKGLIKRIKGDESPFRKTRSFQYDRRGYCISYIDSLFSESDFLSRTVSLFSNNMLFSPKEIKHRKENYAGEAVFTYFETFEYEYRK